MLDVYSRHLLLKIQLNSLNALFITLQVIYLKSKYVFLYIIRELTANEISIPIPYDVIREKSIQSLSLLMNTQKKWQKSSGLSCDN